jgi:hypothetical protein
MTDDIQRFIARWQVSGAAECANCQPFLSELCDVLDLPRPDPTTPDEVRNASVFEKDVPLPHGATGRIDLYRRGCFVLEAKQGSNQPERSQLSEKGGFAPRKRGVAPRSSRWAGRPPPPRSRPRSTPRRSPASPSGWLRSPRWGRRERVTTAGVRQGKAIMQRMATDKRMNEATT